MARRPRRLFSSTVLAPIGLTIVGALGTLVLWNALSIRERSWAGQQVQAESETVARSVAVQLESLIRALERFGERWVSRAGMSESEWVVDAAAMLRDFPGYERVAWADSSRTLRWLIPTTGFEPPNVVQLSTVPELRRFLNQVQADGRPAATWGSADVFADPGMLAAVPLCYLDQCDGFLLGMFQAQPLLDALMPAVSPGYVIVIRGAGRLLAVAPGGESTAPESWSRSAPLQVGAVRWTVTVRPTPLTVATLRSPVPDITLAAGLALSALAGLALRLAAVSERSRRQADLKRAEAEHSEQRFRAMFDSAFQFVALLSLDGRLLETNQTALAFVATDRAALQNVPFWDAPWWNGNDAARDRLERACRQAAQGELVRYEETVQGQGLVTAVLDLSLKPIRSPEGMVTQVLAEGRDVTERKRAEAALQEMDTLSAMGRLAARVAHEINNPLAGIQNAFLLLRDAIPQSHPDYPFVGAIEREISRIANVTRQLYETYRPDQEHRKDCPVATVISDVVSLLRQVNREKQVALVVDVTKAPSVLRVPEGIVRQALYNLVQNAVEVAPRDSSVHVRAWAEGDTFLLTVTDQGPGVLPELREKIFEPFFSTKERMSTGGMGLGLALVKRSVEAIGGAVLVRDAPEGPGAEFRITLPIVT